MYKLIVFLAALLTVFSLNAQAPKDLPSTISVWEVQHHEPTPAVLGGVSGTFIASPDSVEAFRMDSIVTVVIDGNEIDFGTVGEIDYYWNKAAKCWVVYFESAEYSSNGTLYYYGYFVLKGRRSYVSITVPKADLFLHYGDQSLSNNPPARFKATSRLNHERISRMNTIAEKGTIRTRMGAR